MELKIQDEEGFQKSCDWLVEKAVLLDDPLIEGDYRARIMAQYNVVEEEVVKYRRAELAHKFPRLREVYRQLGWEIAEFPGANQAAPADPEPTPEPVPEPEPTPEAPAADVDVSFFFDEED